MQTNFSELYLFFLVASLTVLIAFIVAHTIGRLLQKACGCRRLRNPAPMTEMRDELRVALANAPTLERWMMKLRLLVLSLRARRYTMFCLISGNLSHSVRWRFVDRIQTGAAKKKLNRYARRHGLLETDALYRIVERRVRSATYCVICPATALTAGAIVCLELRMRRLQMLLALEPWLLCLTRVPPLRWVITQAIDHELIHVAQDALDGSLLAEYEAIQNKTTHRLLKRWLYNEFGAHLYGSPWFAGAFLAIVAVPFVLQLK